jgi:hypothetical protein
MGFYTSKCEKSQNHPNVRACRREEAVDEESRGRYSTHVLGARAVEIVHQHAAALGRAAPLFLYLAFQSVHAPLQGKKIRQ